MTLCAGIAPLAHVWSLGEFWKHSRGVAPVLASCCNATVHNTVQSTRTVLSCVACMYDIIKLGAREGEREELGKNGGGGIDGHFKCLCLSLWPCFFVLSGCVDLCRLTYASIFIRETFWVHLYVCCPLLVSKVITIHQCWEGKVGIFLWVQYNT